MKICHLTSVHPAGDIRIFEKECKSLAAHGYEVVLIIKNKEAETRDGIKIIPFPVLKNRLLRVFLSPFRMFFLARRQEARVYHFHDPELIITGLLLRFFTKAAVVYDIHEDYKTSIRQKYYLPGIISYPLACLFGLFEALAARFFHLVLAEKYYSQRFPRGIQVLNYPLPRPLTPGALPGPVSPGPARLIYTGTVSGSRGAYVHARLLTLVKDCEIYFIGSCRKEEADKIREIVGDQKDRLFLEGENQFVLPARIRHYYETGRWLAGLAVFPNSGHYRQKELTKFFEYMAAGIPIICSDFPVWRELVEANGVGLAVNPSEPGALVEAVEFLKTHPEKAAEMGERGKQLTQDRFNWQNEEKKLLELYERIK
ncbi:MAG: glycosyltransferase [Candidatus Aminicenantes bacterium]|nr:glycosyltransferase [Candidatus Aminicenantes bacterium]